MLPRFKELVEAARPRLERPRRDYAIRSKNSGQYLQARGKIFTTLAVSPEKAKANALLVMMNNNSDEVAWYFIRNPHEFVAVPYTEPQRRAPAPPPPPPPKPRPPEQLELDSIKRRFNNAQLY